MNPERVITMTPHKVQNNTVDYDGTARKAIRS